ncbi:hypothetical protein E8E12_003801 [Didymella heteroderae]|uniref:Uncharacterized protein n=1 Tax=Didymella heteroderae TaxID=1769908 RepID=A0A9P4WIG0_9PLEO|nr:hypothetical protein E8E12_003801 [Didymella heteroderae]
MDPFSAGMFASIGSAFKFADVAVRVAEVGSENAVFVRTIYVVRSDLEEVERLLSQEPVQRKLAATPGKLPWIKKAIQNTRYALNEIGRWVERARVEQESKGSIKLDTRVRWVFSDHEKLLNRKTELSTCHQQLSIVLGFLIGLEVAPSQQAEQEYEDTTYFDDILARHRRTSRPKLQNTDSNQKHLAVPPNSMNGYAADPVPSASSHLPPPGSRVTISPTVRTSNPYEREKFIRSKSLTSTLSLPGSPPPTYATAVSVDRFTSAAQPSPRNSCSPPKAYNCVLPGPTADYEITLDSPQNETWAYRSSYEGIAIPELTGDTVVFSATNSAGPVNPYEFCASPGATTRYDINSSRRSRDSIPEMLGDLFFPAELPSNVPGSPTGLPPCSWAATDQVEANMAPRKTLNSTNKDASDHDSSENKTKRQSQENVMDQPSDETPAAAGDKRKKTPPPESAHKATKATKDEQATKTHDEEPTQSNASPEQVLKFLLSDTAVDICRPQDELDDLKKRGEDIKTYGQLLSPFEELVCAVVLSRPISHRLGLRTIRTILNPPWEFTDAETIKAAGAEKIYKSLDDARTQHRGKTTEEIEHIAEAVKDNDWHNDLEKLRKQAKNEVEEERMVLQSSIKGLGKIGLNIFYRRIQWLWEEAFPFIDARTQDSLEKLGLPKKPDEVVELIQENWQDLKFDDDNEYDEEEQKRRAFVLLLERSVGADLEKKIEDILVAAAKSQ